jgi:gluconate kinase
MKNSVDKIMDRRRVAVAAAEKELCGIIAGSFFKRQMKGRVRYCLSRMRDGTQRQVYLSGKDADAVERGARRYARLMNLLRDIGELNLELVKKGVDLDY